MCKGKKVTMSEMITFMIENEVESYELKLKEKLNSNKKEIGMKSRWRF